MSSGSSVGAALIGADWGTDLSRRRAMVARPPMTMLSSFPPRECGIATFARDVLEAIESASHLRNLARLHNSSPWVIAMNEAGQTYEYGSQVRLTIDRDTRAEYREAAQRINASQRTQVVSIQHEYGLFGGEYGDYLLDFIGTLKKPAALTMHTVLERPDHALRRVTEELINRSSSVVVLAQSARDILSEYYTRANLNKVEFIPHGTPSVRREPTERFKRELGLDGYTVLSTFGLLGPDKGIEYAIQALPDIVARHPDVVYLVLGQTHPGQKKHSGESYRESLTRLVDELHLHEHVRFYNRYLSMPELMQFLRATDIYLIPYLNPLQIASGTLSYAVAAGKAVVSTPFVYAREVLGSGRGVLADFRDPRALTSSVNGLLEQPDIKEEIERRAYIFGHRMHWPNVGVAYCRMLTRLADAYASESRKRPVAALPHRLPHQVRPAAAGALSGGLGRHPHRPALGSGQPRIAGAPLTHAATGQTALSQTLGDALGGLRSPNPSEPLLGNTIQ
jgi:glycosyltransferase involved in cell wall biosynthesis